MLPVCACYLLFDLKLISRRDGENNGFLAGISFPPSSRALALAFLSLLKLPFPSPPNACHAG